MNLWWHAFETHETILLVSLRDYVRKITFYLATKTNAFTITQIYLITLSHKPIKDTLSGPDKSGSSLHEGKGEISATHQKHRDRLLCCEFTVSVQFDPNLNRICIKDGKRTQGSKAQSSGQGIILLF